MMSELCPRVWDLRQFIEVGGRERSMLGGHPFLDGTWSWDSGWEVLPGFHVC